PDEGGLFEHGDCSNDFPDARGTVIDVVLGQVIEDAVEVVPHLRGQFDARHPQRASFFAVGREAVNKPNIKTQRSAALFISGGSSFNYPSLASFNRPASSYGIPSSYVYVFAAWASSIGL
ncbi:hypothetical protein OY671_012850, partial [Metschnikowia pulcherrima]